MPMPIVYTRAGLLSYGRDDWLIHRNKDERYIQVRITVVSFVAKV